MSSRILVINPNSSTGVTAAMDRGIAPLRQASGFVVECMTLAEGPPGIETQADIESVILPVARLIGREPADAYVIACFSDPGLALAREVAANPVLGIAESSFQMALGLGQRFGIVSILDKSIPRHHRYARQTGFADRLAGDRAIGFGVTELAGEAVIGRVIEVGRQLRDEDGADVLILGCAGMGHWRPRVEEALAMPVIDPTQAAVARAIAMIALGYQRAA
jgi:Asp/Glu/hydantoin racemase